VRTGPVLGRLTGQELLNGSRVGGFGEKVTLPQFAAQVLERDYLCLMLDALSNHFQAEAVRQHDDDPDNLAGLLVVIHA